MHRLSLAPPLALALLATACSASPAQPAPPVVDDARALPHGSSAAPAPRAPVHRPAAESNAVIRDRRAQFRACYDRAQAEQKTLGGKVEIVFTILPSGAVKDASVDDAKSEIHDQGLAACLVATVTAITFPPSDEEVGSKMHYPFDFRPTKTAPTLGDPALR